MEVEIKFVFHHKNFVDIERNVLRTLLLSYEKCTYRRIQYETFMTVKPTSEKFLIT